MPCGPLFYSVLIPRVLGVKSMITPSVKKSNEPPNLILLVGVLAEVQINE